MNEKVISLAAEFVLELSKATPEDYLQTKLLMLSAKRAPGAKKFLQKVFSLAEERRPLLLEMK